MTVLQQIRALAVVRLGELPDGTEESRALHKVVSVVDDVGVDAAEETQRFDGESVAEDEEQARVSSPEGQDEMRALLAAIPRWG